MRARDEADRRTEAHRRVRPREVETRHRGLSGAVHHWVPTAKRDLLLHRRRQEGQPRQVNPETGAGYHVVHVERGLPRAVKQEPHPATGDGGPSDPVTGERFDHAIDPVFEPPGTYRPEHAFCLPHPHVPRQPPETRRTVPESAMPSLAELVHGPAEMPDEAELGGIGSSKEHLGSADDEDDV